MKKIKFLALLMLVGLVSVSCNDILDDNVNPDRAHVIDALKALVGSRDHQNAAPSNQGQGLLPGPRERHYLLVQVIGQTGLTRQIEFIRGTGYR